MIERYARPRMKRIWSDENRYDKWLLVELAVCEAWTDEGVIPAEDMERLRRATYNMDRLREILQRTRHDMTAFLQSITETLGPEGRWLHLGLTSSDVWDTATGLQMMDAADLLDEEVQKLLEALKARALEHKDTIMMGRTHGVHAEPITFGLKLALWWDEMRRNRRRLDHARETVAVGKLSGPVGTHASVSPNDRGQGVHKAGTRGRARVQPDHSAGPPRPVRHDSRADGRIAGEVRDRGPVASAYGGPRGRGAFRGRPDRLVIDAPQAQPRAV